MLSKIDDLIRPFRLKAASVLILISLEAILGSISIALVIPVISSLQVGKSPWEFLGQFAHFGTNFIGEGLSSILTFMGVAIVAKGILSVSKNISFVILTQQIRVYQANQLTGILLASDYMHLMKRRHGELINIFTRENNRCFNALTSFLNLISLIFQMTLILVTMIFVNLELVLAGAAMIVIATLISRHTILPFSKDLGNRSTVQNGNMVTLFSEAVSLIREIKISGSDDIWKEKINNTLTKVKKIDVLYGCLRSNITPAVELFFGIILVVTALVFFIDNTVDINWLSKLAFFFVGTYRILISASSAFNQLIALVNSEPSIKLIHELIYGKAFKSEKSGKKIIDNNNLIIKFKGLSFSYSADEVILANLSATIHPHKTTYIFGPSGSGKSTLVDLITGLLEPSSGDLLLSEDEIRIEDVDKRNWRRRIGYVSQEPKLLRGTIKENIDLFQQHDDQQIEKILKLVGLYGELDIKTSFIEEGGENISGGQKRRIAIARELIKNPDILILDETLSSISISSEKEIIQKLKKIRKLTTIVISHREESANFGDEILYMPSRATTSKH